MVGFFKVVFAILFFFSGSLVLADNIEVSNKQIEYKEAFENSQRFHSQRMESFLNPTRPALANNEKKLSESVIYGLYKIDVAAINIGEFFGDKILKIAHFVKSKWKSVSGIKGAPPTANGLFYIYGTGGSSPEVLWFADGAVDSDGNIVSYEFTFGDGTSQIIPANELEVGKSISHIYDYPGNYTATVKIVDNDGDFSIYSGSVNVTHTNALPVPKFTLQNNQVPNFLKVDFSSQATDDAGIIRYTWKFGDGSPDTIGATATTATRNYSNPGVYTVGFVVRDSQRAQVSAYTQAYVGQHQPSGGMYPIPLVYADKLAGVAPLNVQFDGEKSFDIGGSISSYEWNFGDFSNPKNISYQAKPSFRYTQPGTYYGSLKVVDNGGRWNTRYFAVYVFPNGASSRAAEIFALPTATSRTFSFDSNYRSIRAAVPSYYQIWNFGDGTPIVKGVYPSHSYANDGVYTVTLKVYDLKGGFQQIQKTLTVNANQNPPISSFYLSKYDAVVNEPIDFVTTNQNFVSATATATWDFGDGTVLSGLHKDLLSVTHSYSEKGFYISALMTTDELGKSSITTYYINIQNADRPVKPIIEMSTRMGTIPLPVKYDAHGTSSSAGQIVKYYWQVWNPSVTQVNENKVWTSAYSTAGDRYVNLYVEDSQGNIGYAADFLSVVDPAEIPPMNQNPNARIQMDFFQTGSHSGISLSGYGSSDPDGDRIVSYEWIFDGSQVSSSPTATIDSIGSNVPRMIALKVKDKWGAVGEHKITFSNPSVSFDYSPVRPVANIQTHFLADEETVILPGDAAFEYKWDFGDGSVFAYGNNPSHSYVSSGTYNVLLTVKGISGRTYRAQRNIQVRADASLEAIITTKDSEGIITPQVGRGFVWPSMPLTVNFDLSASETFGRSIVSATWDLGDGSTAFGVAPSYTYFKPGTYAVTVNVVDSDNRTDSASVTIQVQGRNCGESEGTLGCLRMLSARGKTLPMGSSEWLITHDALGALTWDPELGDDSFIEAKELNDENASPINITSSVIVDGANLKLQKSALQSMGFDFLKEYQIVVRTKLSDGSDYSGMFPSFNFGVGHIDFTTLEAGVRVTLESSNGYKRYFDFGNTTSQVISDLPIGVYSVVAEKNDRKRVYTVNVADSTGQSLTINLSVSAIKEADEKKQRLRKDQVYSGIKDVEALALVNNCGETSPFPQMESRPWPPPGIYWEFLDTYYPHLKVENQRVDRLSKDKLKLFCRFWGNAIRYTEMKWLLYDSQRCAPNYHDLAQWHEYKNEVAGQFSAPLQIDFKVEDAISGHSQKVSYVTTVAQILGRKGISSENITYITGISRDPSVPNLVFGLQFHPEFDIPKDFLRPLVTINLRADSDKGVGFACTFDKEFGSNEILPRALAVRSALGATPGVASNSMPAFHSKDYNGLQVMKDKFFPIGIDSTLSSLLGPNAFKARLLVDFDSGTYLPQEIKKIKIGLESPSGASIGNPAQDPEYILQPEDYVNVQPNSSKFSAYVEVDAAAFENRLSYQFGGEKSLKLKFTPVGEGFNSENVGAAYINNIVPLFEAQRHQASICKDGTYGSNLSLYGDPYLLDVMYSLANPTQGDPIRFLCNDMSLPWGGPFVIGGNVVHTKGHTKGQDADVRYSNVNASRKNEYDGNSAQNRKADVEEYLRLSIWAYKVETDPAYYLVKQRIFNSCTYGTGYAPCGLTTSIVDITRENILKLCQWHSIIDGECIAEAPNYRTAIQNFSTWTELNLKDLLKMTHLRQTIMADGAEGNARFMVPTHPIGFPFLEEKWQLAAINFGLWPDGTKIYKMASTSIAPEVIHSCQQTPLIGCSLGNRFEKKHDHIHHIHLAR